MLAFNLGVFFKNLRGEEVAFSAQTPSCEVHLTGGVSELHEETGLTHQLSVTLSKNHLSLRISFEENEEDAPEDTEVDVSLTLNGEEEDQLLLHTTFRFGDISIKPVSELEEGERPAISGAENPGPDDPELA